METRCQKCGAPVGADQAFCPRCGAVIGMSAPEPAPDEGWDMTATLVGQRLPAAHAPRPSAAPTPVAPRADSAPTQTRQGGNTVLLAVIGFVAVLLLGGLLILLLFLNSRG